MRRAIDRFLKLRLYLRLYWAGAAVTVAAFLSLLLGFNSTLFTVMLYLGYGLAAIGFGIWIFPVVVRLWKAPMGKQLIILVNALVGIVAIIVARNNVAEAFGLPPQDFDMTVAIFSLLMYLPVWFVVVGAILLWLGLSFVMVDGVLMILNTHPLDEVIDRIRIRFRLGSTPIDSNDRLVAEGLGHAAGALALGVGLWLLVVYTSSNVEMLYPAMKWVAFFGDYHSLPAYPGVGANERVLVHENGVISTITAANGDFEISVRVIE